MMACDRCTTASQQVQDMARGMHAEVIPFVDASGVWGPSATKCRPNHIATAVRQAAPRIGMLHINPHVNQKIDKTSAEISVVGSFIVSKWIVKNVNLGFTIMPMSSMTSFIVSLWLGNFGNAE